ncbi:hypothetical protein EHI8A_058400 [Entamoeba histolytica HM-1:IMSS-B]|uniref:Uncharacterized protein n=6 Tax=Entamoeba histolytica TaxID=5759 RepID=C4LYS3_ENTH1|nr:hypothetical protein EHI_004630 [Entamoeba histolytica HM-1:IMSS]EMD47322.1 Hypothetical protein EHI5A_101810 [Entamoeba histolytica KU27]EMH77692.1 hypothetical protein EHI8A_058400 [Entamoeba histolytica HM-1:IMSS-B]EMS11700.1 hypothetical protein KM1_116470 [Entamoeba histolytica HM-3:IMSS]ENY65858.1 hypothetical protein EHI7A_057180 [Entamoeba histolytica HM-1:IMSS-A]GAT93985.1 hypothetical protein CL6EHI_004630 [Entamoeba histolytica]|eukprot:XP_656793.1 hypothetical protein EHI_004630 [Entamoeba histolytica HM-1:IMSS]
MSNNSSSCSCPSSSSVKEFTSLTLQNKLLKQKENTKTALLTAFVIGVLNWVGCTIIIHKRKRTATKSMQYFDVAEIRGPITVTSNDIDKIVEEFEKKQAALPSTVLSDPSPKDITRISFRHKAKSARCAMFNKMMNVAEEIGKNEVSFEVVNSKRTLLTIKKKGFNSVKLAGKTLNKELINSIASLLHRALCNFVDNFRELKLIDKHTREVVVLNPHFPLLEYIFSSFGVPYFHETREIRELRKSELLNFIDSPPALSPFSKKKQNKINEESFQKSIKTDELLKTNAAPIPSSLKTKPIRKYWLLTDVFLHEHGCNI